MPCQSGQVLSTEMVWMIPNHFFDLDHKLFYKYLRLTNQG